MILTQFVTKSDNLCLVIMILSCQRPQNVFILNVFAKAFIFKIFSQNSFRGSLRISLSMGRNADRGKVAYSWISPDPAKAGPTLRGGVVVVIYIV